MPGANVTAIHPTVRTFQSELKMGFNQMTNNEETMLCPSVSVGIRT